MTKDTFVEISLADMARLKILAPKMVNTSGGTSLSEAEDEEMAKLQEKYPGISLERAANCNL